jgi:hypothetical protein
MYWIHSPREFHKQCKEVHAFADYYVNLALTTDLTKATATPSGRQKYVSFLTRIISDDFLFTPRALTTTSTGSLCMRLLLPANMHTAVYAYQRRKNAPYPSSRSTHPLKPTLLTNPVQVFLAELVKSTRDPLELRSQLLNILLAGRDTTAGLLGWTFYVLARNPAAYAKLRKVILDTFGTYSNPRDITFANLKACGHLQHVLSEILRLYATVPLNSRRATRDTTLPRGGGPDGLSPVYIRKDQEVNYAVHIMHRRKDIWGEDADEFRPERWEGKKVGWEFLPFNGGPRICLGQQFALTEAGFVIVRLAQRFGGVENLDAEQVVRHQYSLTTSPKRCAVRLRVGES